MIKTRQPIAINKTIDLQSTSQKAQMEKQMRGAAQMYEKLFLNEMVKAMRSTVDHSQLTKPSMAENIFQDQLFDNYTNSWSEKGGVGLANVIYNQLVERFSPYHRQPEAVPQGPVHIPQQKGSGEGTVTPIPTTHPSQMKFQIKSPQGERAELQAPWAAHVSRVVKGEGDLHILELEHADGWKSQMGFSGGKVLVSPGQDVGPGEKLAEWESGCGDLQWIVEDRNQKA